jgi:hypothetical protein
MELRNYYLVLFLLNQPLRKPPDNPDPKVVIQNTTSNFSAIEEESFHPDPDVSPSFSRLI